MDELWDEFGGQRLDCFLPVVDDHSNSNDAILLDGTDFGRTDEGDMASSLFHDQQVIAPFTSEDIGPIIDDGPERNMYLSDEPSTSSFVHEAIELSKSSADIEFDERLKNVGKEIRSNGNSISDDESFSTENNSEPASDGKPPKRKAPTKGSNSKRARIPKSVQAKLIARASEEANDSSPKKKDVLPSKQLLCCVCDSALSSRHASSSTMYCSEECMRKQVENTRKHLRDDTERIMCINRKGVMVNGSTLNDLFEFLKENPGFQPVIGQNCSSPPLKVNTTETDDKMRISAKQTVISELQRRAKESNMGISAKRCKTLGEDIEAELFRQHPEKWMYRQWCKAFISSLRDNKNQLFESVILGEMSVKKLMTLDVSEMTVKPNEQKDLKRANCFTRASTSISPIQEKPKTHLHSNKTNGAVEEQKVQVKSAIDDILGDGDKDTTSQHMSHLYDTNCSICRSKSSLDLGTKDRIERIEAKKAAKKRMEESIKLMGEKNIGGSLIAEETAEKNEDDTYHYHSPAKVVIAASPVPVMRNGSNTVQQAKRESPVKIYQTVVPAAINNKQSVHERINSLALPSNGNDSDATSWPRHPSTVWSGSVLWGKRFHFTCSALPISNLAAFKMRKDIPEDVRIIGRIEPTTVWDYIGLLRESCTNDIVLFLLQPEGNFDNGRTFFRCYEKMRKENQYAVLDFQSSHTVKDGYIFPLEPEEPLPRVLTPLEGPGVPEGNEINANILLLLVRHKKRKEKNIDKAKSHFKSEPKRSVPTMEDRHVNGTQTVEDTGKTQSNMKLSSREQPALTFVTNSPINVDRSTHPQNIISNVNNVDSLLSTIDKMTDPEEITALISDFIKRHQVDRTEKERITHAVKAKSAAYELSRNATEESTPLSPEDMVIGSPPLGILSAPPPPPPIAIIPLQSDEHVQSEGGLASPMDRPLPAPPTPPHFFNAPIVTNTFPPPPIPDNFGIINHASTEQHFATVVPPASRPPDDTPPPRLFFPPASNIVRPLQQTPGPSAHSFTVNPRFHKRTSPSTASNWNSKGHFVKEPDIDLRPQSVVQNTPYGLVRDIPLLPTRMAKERSRETPSLPIQRAPPRPLFPPAQSAVNYDDPYGVNSKVRPHEQPNGHNYHHYQWPGPRAQPTRSQYPPVYSNKPYDEQRNGGWYSSEPLHSPSSSLAYEGNNSFRRDETWRR